MNTSCNHCFLIQFQRLSAKERRTSSNNRKQINSVVIQNRNYVSNFSFLLNLQQTNTQKNWTSLEESEKRLKHDDFYIKTQIESNLLCSVLGRLRECWVEHSGSIICGSSLGERIIALFVLALMWFGEADKNSRQRQYHINYTHRNA